MKTALLLDSDLVFGPKRVRAAIIAASLIGLGGAMGWGERGKPVMPANGAPLPIAQLITDATIGFIMLVGLAFLVTMLAGIPRLTATRQGVTLRTLFRTTRVPWSRLGTFSVVYGQGRHAERAIKATAPVLPSADEMASGAIKGHATLVIPDVFEWPLTDILHELNAWHGNAALPTVVDFEAVAERPVGIPGFRWPWLTASLLAMFVAVFVLEQRLAITPSHDFSPTVATLIALGGLSLDLAHAGQWYRVLTAPFLHTGVAHLVANGIAFLFAGYALERFVGRAWTFCVFAAGALAGSFVSLSFSSPSTVSVGASGAIMSMLVALFMISFRLPPGRAKTFIQVQSARVAIPALIPVSSAAVDYGAHFGGALFGGVLGLLLLFTWEENSPLPTLRGTATLFAVVAALSFARCAVAVADHYDAYTVIATWMPTSELPNTVADTARRADSLLATYPLDPRAHFYVANARLQKNDRVHAEQQLRLAIAGAEAFPSMFPPSMVSSYRVLLAQTVLDLGREPEARVIAKPACTAEGESVPEPAFKAALDRSGLCKTAGIDGDASRTHSTSL